MTEPATDRHTCHDQRAATGPAWKCPRCSAAPLPPAVPSTGTPREQVLAAIDGTRVPPLGYATPEGLLAAYDASCAPAAADRTGPSLRAGLQDEIVNALGQIATAPPVAHRREQADHVLAVLYREWPWLRAEAEDASASVSSAEMVAVDQAAPREAAASALAAVEAALGDTLVPAARAEALAEITAVLPTPVAHAAVVRACATFVGDTYSGEWADDAAATLETDADKIERGEPCSLLRLAAVLPATTRHDTDTVTAWAPCSPEWLRSMPDGACSWAPRKAGDGATVSHYHPALPTTVDRAAVLREAITLLDQRASSIDALSSSDFGEEARAVRELTAVANELRRVADETAATETQPEACPPGCIACATDESHDPAPAAGARQDGAQR